MNDWNTLEWIGAMAGIATIVGTGYALLRRTGSKANRASASGERARAVQLADSPDSTIVMDSPAAVVVQGDLHVTPGYPAGEHERIVNERVAEARADMERAHQAEVDALRARIAAFTEPEWDRGTINAIQAAVTAGQFDRAEELMSRLEESHLEAASISAAEKQVRVRQMRAVNALVNGDARQAREHVEAAAAVLAAFDPINAADFRNEAAMHMQDYGERVGGGGIAEAIRLYRTNLAQLNRETHPEPWAETQHNLGNALLLHAVRSDERLSLLTEAIEAFHAALQVCTRTEFPDEWAQTQISLGGALMVLGSRSEGAEGADYLGEAVSVLRAAEQVCTRETDPDTWANIRSNLAVALANQGVRRRGEEGVGLLDEGIEVSRELLQVVTCEDHPLNWAHIQTNLSFALAERSDLVGNSNAVDFLRQAVKAARSSLQVYTRERHPLDWAKAHANIGAILNDQSLYEEQAAALECLQASNEALQSALQVYTREDLPIQWAGAQLNLGLTYLRTAQRHGGREGLGAIAEALSAWRNALQVFTRAKHPLDWAKAQFNLGAALLYRGEWTGGTKALPFLHEAVAAFQHAIQVYVRDVHPSRSADAHRCLGRVYELIADFGAENPLEKYERALREIDRALEVPPHLQDRECLEDARSTKERLRGKIAALEGP